MDNTENLPVKGVETLQSGTRVALLINPKDLENDDRYGWFARELGGDKTRIGVIAFFAERSVKEAIQAAYTLFEEGYLEVCE